MQQQKTKKISTMTAPKRDYETRQLPVVICNYEQGIFSASFISLPDPSLWAISS
jgi:hypothetical protein